MMDVKWGDTDFEKATAALLSIPTLGNINNWQVNNKSAKIAGLDKNTINPN